MNKGGGVGVGSASIVLVFAVLCLSVFSLITLVVAGNSKALVDSQARFVTEYYEVDAFAEHVLAEILEIEFLPEEFEILGVEVQADFVWQLDAYIIRFTCPIAESGKSLYVKLARYYDSYEILIWRMWDENEWSADEGLNVWIPDDGLDIWLGFDSGDEPGFWLLP